MRLRRTINYKTMKLFQPLSRGFQQQCKRFSSINISLISSTISKSTPITSNLRNVLLSVPYTSCRLPSTICITNGRTTATAATTTTTTAATTATATTATTTAAATATAAAATTATTATAAATAAATTTTAAATTTTTGDCHE